MVRVCQVGLKGMVVLVYARGLFEEVFAGYLPLVSHNPEPIVVNSVANCRPRISHLWLNNVILAIPS